MNSHRALSSCARLAALALLILLPRLAAAAWPSDPTVNVPVCTAPKDQLAPVIVSDGAGGAIVAWMDRRGATYDIYAQHVLASGVVDSAWPPNGRALCADARVQTTAGIVSDRAGGAIVAWSYGLQHVLANGEVDVAWPANGRALGVQVVVSDGAGGAVVVSSTNASHVLASGALDPAWPANGRVYCSGGTSKGSPAATSDGAGGVIVTWSDLRIPDNSYDIYAQHVLAGGVVDPGWHVDGQSLCAATNGQYAPVIVTDGKRGAIVAWNDNRSGTQYDIFAQHVLASGTVDSAWAANGLALCTAAGAQYNVRIVADGAGGAIVTWDDTRGGNYDVYAQHVLAGGSVDPAWPADGRLLCAAPGDQNYPSIVADGLGGAIVTWRDYRSGAYNDIYAQHVLPNGALDPAWPPDGRALCTAPGFQTIPMIATDGAGGAIVTWADNRSGANYDIYAQRVQANGLLGDENPTPTLVSLVSADVREGAVRLRWLVSLDASATLTAYRSAGTDAWQALGTVRPDGSDYVSYEDAAVASGARYGYRLGVRAGGAETYAGEAWVDVPGTDFAVRVPNPIADGQVTVSFAAPADRPVRVSLLDLAGRVVSSRLATGGGGRQSVSLARAGDLAPGVYLVRVELDRPVVKRVAVIR